jgi:hypothetical protein
MSKEMRKYIDTFKQKLTESENLNKSDVSSSKIIYTVLPYFSGGNEVNQNGVKSFTQFEKAE